MKHLLFIVCVSLFSFKSFGAIKLAVELAYGEKKISPEVTLNSGQTTTITQDELKIQIKAVEQDKKVATLFFHIFENERLVASPSLRTLFGKPAEVRQGKTGQDESIHLKVTPSQVP